MCSPMTRTDEEVQKAADQLGDLWKYDKESPASHRTIEEGARIALEDVLDGNVDKDLIRAAVNPEDEDFNNFENLFNFGYVDAVLWYLERETLSEQFRENDQSAIGEPLNVE